MYHIMYYHSLIFATVAGVYNWILGNLSQSLVAIADAHGLRAQNPSLGVYPAKESWSEKHGFATSELHSACQVPTTDGRGVSLSLSNITLS